MPDEMPKEHASTVADGVEALTANVDNLDGSSLYFGLAGIAGGPQALAELDAANQALDRIRDRFDALRRRLGQSPPSVLLVERASDRAT